MRNHTMKSYRCKWYYLHHLTQLSGSIIGNNHVFAIGDVHSRSDLLAIMIDAIDGIDDQTSHDGFTPWGCFTR